MGLFGNMFYGASSASLWTGNMIYTALQNAKTKKEVRELYNRASETNFKNRSVAILPSINKQQLLLASGDPSENDIYDYQSNSSTAALDYIWGESEEPEGIIVSGGQPSDRVCALIPFVHKAQVKEIPVVALHTGNVDLEQMISSHSRAYEFISRKDAYYDVFRGLPVEDIAYLLYETMPQDSTNPAAESLLHALLEILSRTSGNITIQSLAAFPLLSLKSKIDEMHQSGQLSADEYAEINRYYMSGSAESDSVRIFLNKLNRQAEAIYGKLTSRPCNVKRLLNQKGVIAIDVGTTGNDILLSLVINHLLLLQAQGREFAILIDNVPLSKDPKLSELTRCKACAVSNNDFISSLYGGEKRGEDLFSEITGSVSAVVLFRHASGTSCQKWSEHLGTYNKIHIRYSLSQSKAFMNSNDSRGLSVEEKEEPRVRAETINKLPNGLACIHTIDGTLFAEVACP